MPAVKKEACVVVHSNNLIILLLQRFPMQAKHAYSPRMLPFEPFGSGESAQRAWMCVGACAASLTSQSNRAWRVPRQPFVLSNTQS